MLFAFVVVAAVLQEVLETRDPIDVVAAALARTSHTTHLFQKGLLTGKPGFGTLVIKLVDPIRTPTVVYVD